MKSLPFGFFESKITAADVAGSSLRLSDLTTSDGAVYWLEQRPLEGGRGVVMRYAANDGLTECTPSDLSVRSQVHEYGGGAFGVGPSGIFCSSQSDQAVYLVVNGKAIRLTKAIPERRLRFADYQEDTQRQRVICVREDHRNSGEAVNSLVSISYMKNDSEGEILASGYDFYASPRLSPDKSRLAWLCWRHPQMPWNGTELWIADIAANGSLVNQALVAGGNAESIFQPEWSPSGILHWISDKSGYWNLYSSSGEFLFESAHDFGKPQWVFGLSTYAFVSDTKIVCSYCESGEWKLSLFDTTTKSLSPLNCSFTDFTGVRVAQEKTYVLGASPRQAISVLSLASEVIRKSSEISIGAEWISEPRSIEFESAKGRKVHAFYYAPKNPNYFGTGKPPLLVKCHGGPVSAASSGLSLATQYWTSRGFAFLDVNYGGSTGFGRKYRERLSKAWGLVDVEDCIAGAQFVSQQGLVNPHMLFITGSSAGGFTVLNAAGVSSIFKAGASYYGISDLELLKQKCPKFESHDLEELVGSDLAGRSPISKVDKISTPIIFFQGLDDVISLPEQTQLIHDRLKERGVVTELHMFKGEGHGFRRAETIVTALESELNFYRQFLEAS